MKDKKFEFYNNWYWHPECGHYGFIRIFSKKSLIVEALDVKSLRKWFDHLGDGPVFPEE